MESKPKPELFTKILSLQADIIYNCLVTIFSPFKAIFSTATESYRRAEDETAMVESVILRLPINISHFSALLLRKVGSGIFGAGQMGIVLIMVMLLSGFLGFGLVQMWVEEPVFCREKLFFDYTDVNPTAVFGFVYGKQQQMGIPVGHTFHVSLVLSMPDSWYNREVGVFQLTAEVLSANGNMMAKSSQPRALRFRSLPVRLLRTFIMGLPLILGISEETQKMTVDLLKHKEGYPRTKAIRIMMVPRALTRYLPQIYEAEIMLKSQQPWMKQIVHNWKWTFRVWVSISIYIFLLIILSCLHGSLLFPMAAVDFIDHRLDGNGNGNGNGNCNGDGDGDGNDFSSEESKHQGPAMGGREIRVVLREWQQRRKKRKAVILREEMTETVFTSSAASSMTFSREDASSMGSGEDVGDSESVCLGE